MSGNPHERNSSEFNNRNIENGFSAISDPLYQLTTRSVGRQLPQRHDLHLRTSRPQLITSSNVSEKSCKN